MEEEDDFEFGSDQFNSNSNSDWNGDDAENFLTVFDKHVKKTYPCPKCHKHFNRKWDLKRHMETKNIHAELADKNDKRKRKRKLAKAKEELYQPKAKAKRNSKNRVWTPGVCKFCGKCFARKHDAIRHEKKMHKGASVASRGHSVCGKYCGNDGRQCHTTTTSRSTSEQLKNENVTFEEKKKCIWCGNLECCKDFKYCKACGETGRECSSCKRPLPQKIYTSNPLKCNACHKKSQTGGAEHALNGTVSTTTLNPEQKWDLLKCFAEVDVQILENLKEDLHIHKGIVWFVGISIKFSKLTVEGATTYHEGFFRSKNVVTTIAFQLKDQLAEAYQKIYASFEAFMREGSGWCLESIVELSINVAKYAPLAGNSYIPTPKELADKKAIVNVQNDDDLCLKWATLSALFPQEVNPYRKNHYTPHARKISMTGIDTPTPLNQILKFEKINDLSINVFTYEKDIIPLYISSRKSESNKKINLLLLTDGEVYHYTWIKCFSRLMAHRTKHTGAQYYCYFCLHGFSSQRVLEKHGDLCQRQDPQRIDFPEDPWISFKNIDKQLPVPFIIYADFESFTTKSNIKVGHKWTYSQISTSQTIGIWL